MSVVEYCPLCFHDVPGEWRIERADDGAVRWTCLAHLPQVGASLVRDLEPTQLNVSLAPSTCEDQA